MREFTNSCLAKTILYLTNANRLGRLTASPTYSMEITMKYLIDDLIAAFCLIAIATALYFVYGAF